MATTSNKKVKFDASQTIGTGSEEIALATLLTGSSSDENAGTIYFTQGSTGKIILNGIDYTGVKKVEVGTNNGNIKVDGTELAITGWSNKANLSSPSFTGTPTVPTPTASGPGSTYVAEQIVNVGFLGNRISDALNNTALTGTPTAPTANTGTNTTQIATTAFVQGEIASKIAATDALAYKGTKAGGSTGDYGAFTPAGNAGDTWKISAAGKINGVPVEVGDMIICTEDGTVEATVDNYTTIATKWNVIQSNIDGAVIGPSSSTDAHIAVFDGTTGKVIKDGTYTIGQSVPSSSSGNVLGTTETYHYTPATADNGKSVSLIPGGTQKILTAIDIDSKGHIVSTTSSDLTKTMVGLSSVTNNAQVKGLSSGTTSGHLVSWGADGYTVADSGITASDVSAAVTNASNAISYLTWQ